MGKDADFLDAARNGNVQVVEKFLSAKTRRSGPLASLRRGPGANVQDSCGYTALHHASLNGHRTLVSTLLRHEASINVQDNKGSTALHLAAWAGHDQVIKVLLQQGPSVPHINHQNKAGDTALHFAAQYGHTETVRLLLHHNGDPTLPNLKAETPLDLAAQFGRLTIAELLIKQAKHDLLRPFAADAATTAVFPHTPLHLASRNGHLAVVKLLLSHGHHVNVRTSQGGPLHEAALCGKVDVVRSLMEAGADPEVKNDLGFTVIDTISSIHTPVTQEISSLLKSLHARLIDLDDDIAEEGSSSSTPPPPFANVPLDIPGATIAPSFQFLSSALSFERPSSAPCSSVRSSIKTSSCSQSVDSSSSSPSSIAPILPPSHFGSPYENVLVPTQLSNPDGETLSRSKEKRLNRSSRSYRPLPEAGRMSDRESRLSDRDTGRFSDCDGRMSITSDHSLTYDVPPPRKTSSDVKFISTRSSSIHNVLDEEVYEIPPAPRKFVQSRRSLRDLSSEGELSNKPNPPPKPPRRSICPSSPTPTDGDDESSYELICLASSLKGYESAKSNKDKADSKSLGDYNYKSLSHAPPRSRNYNYSSDSDSDSGQRRLSGHSNKIYTTMNFKPVKSRRTTKSNSYENTTHTYENVEHQKGFKMYFDEESKAIPFRTRNHHESPRNNHSKKTKSMAFRSRTSDFTSDDSEIDARPKSLNFVRGNGLHAPSSPSQCAQPPTPDHPPPSARQAKLFIQNRIKQVSQEMDQKRRSRDIETETEPEDSLLINVQSTGVGSSLPPTDDEGLVEGENQGVGSSSCSLSSASVTSLSDNIEEIKSDVPFAGLYRGSRSSAKWSSPSDIPALERPRSLTSPASTFRGFDKDFRSSYPSLKSTNNNSNESDKSDKGSVLSPLEEDEEWARISDIMASFGGGVTRESVFMAELEQEFQQRLGMSLSPSQQKISFLTPPVDVSDETNTKQEVPEDIGIWLNQHGLGQYEATFLAHGFDHTHFLNGLLDKQDLQDIGVTDKSHCDKLTTSINDLPATITTLSTNHKPFDCLSDWLSAIGLMQYERIFLKHGFHEMERVQKIWEVELSVVLEVTRPGHRKRMLSSLGNRPIEPELPPSLAPQDLSVELSKLNTDISELKEKLFNELPFSTSREYRPPETATNTIRRATTKRRAAPPPPPPKAPRAQVDSSSELKNVPVCSKKLALRNPSQLVVGFANSSLTQWKHHPTKLVESNVQYLAQYLGSTHVKELKGTDSTMKSIQKLRQTTAKGAKVPKILLSVSYQGVRFIDGETKRVVCEHEVRNIHCACQDADDLTHFAYITKDVETNGHFCHVFRVDEKNLAAEIIMTLGEAFEVAYQMTLRDQFLANQSDEEKLAHGHTRSKSEHVKNIKSKFTHERSLSLVNNQLPVEGTTAPNTSLENLLSDSGNFSDKDCEAFSSSKKAECSSPSASSNSTNGGEGGSSSQQNSKNES